MKTEKGKSAGKQYTTGSNNENSSFFNKDGLPLNGSFPEDITPETVDYMRGLIESFNVSAATLNEAYTTLQSKFDRLNLKLEETNRELSSSLQEQERLSNYLTNILESLSSGVLVVDRDGIITLFNRGAESITGIPVNEAQGKHYREVLGDNTPVELTPLLTLSNGEYRSNMEKQVYCRDGRKIPVGFSTSPLINKSGEMIGAVEIFMDLSRIRALEEEISRMDKLAALGQMAATMAHKIRNPLGGITGFAGLLQFELEGNDNGIRLLGKITEGVDKLNRIVSNLLSYTSRLKLRPRTIDIKERVGKIIYAVKEEHPEKTTGISFSIGEPGGSVSAEVDAAHFSEAILHLIRNAVEALTEGGNVTVEIFRSEFAYNPANPVCSQLLKEMHNSSTLFHARQPSVVIIISDNGTGMDEETAGNLFVPFFTTKENGTGLGLSASRKIIEAHRGEIFISSVLHKGTAAGIIVPRTCVL
ncbi:MAG: PAS domain-containing protein [Candidatus Latescibacteria bacterium]|nr:PAS domain-containing protein [Candidatus Latescibacterota bacterium]